MNDKIKKINKNKNKLKVRFVWFFGLCYMNCILFFPEFCPKCWYKDKSPGILLQQSTTIASDIAAAHQCMRTNGPICYSCTRVHAFVADKWYIHPRAHTHSHFCRAYTYEQQLNRCGSILECWPRFIARYIVHSPSLFSVSPAFSGGVLGKLPTSMHFKADWVWSLRCNCIKYDYSHYSNTYYSYFQSEHHCEINWLGNIIVFHHCYFGIAH